MQENTIQYILNSFRVIVPEIQREYVWGNEKDLIINFLDDIQSSVKEKGSKNIGFLYSYTPSYVNKTSEVFLIDGQQRFTTLFLLLFYLAIRDGEQTTSKFHELIFKSENKGQISFDYKVRILTHSFISDLLEHVSSVEDVKNIRKAIWFHSAYGDDPSIKAICNFFNILSANTEKYSDLTFESVLSNVKFWYFKSEETSQGEELYITMNSRGESLTDSENIKSQLFNGLGEKNKLGKKWSLWEDFFWSLPQSQEYNGNVLGIDKYIDSFIELVLQCISGKEKYFGSNNDFSRSERSLVTFDVLEEYFGALYNITVILEEESGHLELDNNFIVNFFKNKSETKNRIPLVALLQFLKKTITKDIESLSDYREDYTTSDSQLREIARVYHFFRNAIRRTDARAEQNAVLELINKAKISLPNQIYLDTFLTFEVNDNHKLLTKHELDKVMIAKKSGLLRHAIESLFWKTERETSYILKGSLQLFFNIINWKDEQYTWDNDKIDLLKLKIDQFSTLFSQVNIKKYLSDESEINNSLLCRALLCVDDYSIESGENWAFGYDSYWGRIMETEKGMEVVCRFIQQIPKECYTIESLIVYINQLIADYIDLNDNKSKAWDYYFVKYPRMTVCKNQGQNLYRWYSDTNVEMLNTTMMSGYHSNPYLWTLYNEIPNKKELFRFDGYLKGGISSFLSIEEGVDILVARDEYSWIVRIYKSTTFGMNTLLENLKPSYPPNEESDFIDYFFNVDTELDFIQEGVVLITTLLKNIK